MEEKKRVSEGRATERELEDENLQTVLFTAGTALFMLCLKRIIVMFFLEQWRSWVFLFLNLVLLAIFFTSIHKTPSENHESGNVTVEVKTERKKKRKQSKCPVPVEVCRENRGSHKLYKGENGDDQIEREDVEEHSETAPGLSKEELNERVEAFISMFRKHLVLDAKKGRDQLFPSQEQSNFVKLRQEPNMTFATTGVNCLILGV